MKKGKGLVLFLKSAPRFDSCREVKEPVSLNEAAACEPQSGSRSLLGGSAVEAREDMGCFGDHTAHWCSPSV